MNNEALVSGIASLVAVALYLYLGWRLSRRRVAPESRFAAAQFSLFWLGLAAVSALGGLESLMAVNQVPPLTLVVTLLYLEILLLCVVLWALVSYLLFLFTGQGFLVPISLLYAGLYVLLLYFITASDPVRVTVKLGVVGEEFANTVSGPILGVLLLVLLAPEFVGALLYFSLYFRTRDPTVRYRVTLVSWSLIGWFGLGFVDVGSALGGTLAAQIVARSIGLIAAVVILLAFYPPAPIRRRFGISAVEEIPRGSAS